MRQERDAAMARNHELEEQLEHTLELLDDKKKAVAQLRLILAEMRSTLGANQRCVRFHFQGSLEATANVGCGVSGGCSTETPPCLQADGALLA